MLHFELLTPMRDKEGLSTAALLRKAQLSMRIPDASAGALTILHMRRAGIGNRMRSCGDAASALPMI